MALCNRLGCNLHRNAKTMKLALLALIGAAAAIHTPTQIKALRYRGGAGRRRLAIRRPAPLTWPPAMGGMGDMMGGLGGMPGMPTDPAEYEAAMEQLLDSPMMNEFLGDPEKIEQSRQALLNNPRAVNRMKSMPGFDEIINDKDKFRERMLESRKQFEDMKAERAAAKAAESAAASEFDD